MTTVSPKEIIEERIYLGNVDYKATKEDLEELFEGFKITEVEIPTKTAYSGKKTFNKSLGFAFIQFATKEEADKVVEDFTGKEFKGRKIYVKKAVPPPTAEEKQKKSEEFKAKALAKKKAAQEAAAANKVIEDEKSSNETGEAVENGEGKSKTKASSAPKATKPKKAKRAPIAKLPLEEGSKSNDTIFITNLPFDANNKTLQVLFKEYKPKWIHVPIKRIPFKYFQQQKAKGKAPRNKGIAFVKFSDEDLQKKAIEEFNGTEISDRKIIVDVAIDARIIKSIEDEEEAAPEQKEETSADEVTP